jgi:hypothetical protein
VDGSGQRAVRWVVGHPASKRPRRLRLRLRETLVTADITKAVEASASRPLTQLVLTARTTAGAKLLSQLAQPFGASSISLNVSVAGEVKGGGTMGLNIEGVKHTHPVKPLDVATAIANSLTSSDSFRGFADAGVRCGAADGGRPPEGARESRLLISA